MNKWILLFGFIFCFSAWLLEKFNKLDHSFQGEFGTQTVKQPAHLASLLPPSQGDEWNVHEVAWQASTFLWERCSSESFGTLRGKCVGVVGQIANDPTSRKYVWSTVGPRMLCRGPARSLPWLRGRNWHCPVFPTAAQALDSTDHLQHCRDGSSLQESHQGVPLLQLIFMLLPLLWYSRKWLPRDFPNPLLLSSLPPAAFSGLPQERELQPNAFSFSSSTSLCCLKCTL